MTAWNPLTDGGLPAPDVEDGGLGAFADAVSGLVAGAATADVLARIAAAAAAAAGAQLALVREASEEGLLVARAVWAESDAVASEVEGSRLAAGEGEGVERELTIGGDAAVPAAIERVALRVGAGTVAIFPAPADGPGATVELYRRSDSFAPVHLAAGRLAAAHAGLALALARAERMLGEGEAQRRASLELAGAALAAGSDEVETAEQVVRLACRVSGARGAALWRTEPGTEPVFLAEHGSVSAEEVADAVAAVIAGDPDAEGPHVVPLGQPPAGALVLFCADGDVPREDDLSSFAARASVALRRTRRADLLAEELRRSQTLISVVRRAHAQLSLSHTLDTAVAQVVELVGGDVAVYLRDDERLSLAAASDDLAGPHEVIAERLLELALGPARGRGYVRVDDLRRDARLAGLEAAVGEVGLPGALAVPLTVADETVGLIAVYRRRRSARSGEEGLLLAVSSQLAAAVQNARMHERTKELGSVLERALANERRAARQLRGLFEISHSFTRSLSLEATLDAVARTVVELFRLDAAAIRMPNARGETLEPSAIYVADPALRESAEAILARPQPMSAPLARKLLRSGHPVLVPRGTTRRGDAHALLEPFLARGATAAVLPLGTTGEILGTLTLLSLDPTRPLDSELLEAAETVAAQAALAIDNARLYQQQKDFSETMQRSLLPRELPAVAGLEVGHVYESSAGVEVGGDVYDFLVLEDGRLAVVLGDVTGKGIQAAADMAMAKFAFRSLARTHPEPADFLATANDVVVDEIEDGKFITMAYLLADGAERTVACASAGHPPARLVRPDSSVSSLGAGGVALGIDAGLEYEEERVELPAGSAIVLYTDGVIESRRNGELYGQDRLDAFLVAHAGEAAQTLADGILADCRSFAGGALGDDCAVVCIRLAP